MYKTYKAYLHYQHHCAHIRNIYNAHKPYTERDIHQTECFSPFHQYVRQMGPDKLYTFCTYNICFFVFFFLLLFFVVVDFFMWKSLISAFFSITNKHMNHVFMVTLTIRFNVVRNYKYQAPIAWCKCNLKYGFSARIS